METLVAVITVNEPTWPWWILCAGIVVIVLGIQIGRGVRHSSVQNVAVGVLAVGFALILCGIMGGAAVDAGREDRQIEAIEHELGYTDIVFYDEGLFSHGYEFTAESNGQAIHGRIIVEDKTISVLVQQ